MKSIVMFVNVNILAGVQRIDPISCATNLSFFVWWNQSLGGRESL